jgi:hypothetical protein
MTYLNTLRYSIIKNNTRKIFHLNKRNTIFAGGVLLYKIDDNQIYVLMSLPSYTNDYEDIGGKIEFTDTNIYDTVIRETMEETNDKIYIDKCRLEKSQSFYNGFGKYMLFLTKATQNESKYTPPDFGDYEIHDNIKRKIQWISDTEFLQYANNICKRINFEQIYNALINIKMQSIQINKDFSYLELKECQRNLPLNELKECQRTLPTDMMIYVNLLADTYMIKNTGLLKWKNDQYFDNISAFVSSI